MTTEMHRPPTEAAATTVSTSEELEGRESDAGDPPASKPLECPVCYEALGISSMAMRCGHSFCPECIATWQRLHSTCPMCRSPIDQDDVYDISADMGRPESFCAIFERIADLRRCQTERVAAAAKALAFIAMHAGRLDAIEPDLAAKMRTSIIEMASAASREYSPTSLQAGRG